MDQELNELRLPGQGPLRGGVSEDPDEEEGPGLRHPPLLHREAGDQLRDRSNPRASGVDIN